MPYVERDGEDKIIGLYARSQPGRATEWLANDHADVVDYKTPAPKTVLTYEEFEDRFTDAEQQDIAKFVYATDASTGVPVRPEFVRNYNRAVASNSVNLEAPSVVAFLEALVSANIISEARKDEILTP